MRCSRMVKAARRRDKYDECEGACRRHQKHSAGGRQVLSRLNSVSINVAASLYVKIQMI